jgi:hypothetical protein
MMIIVFIVVAMKIEPLIPHISVTNAGIYGMRALVANRRVLWIIVGKKLLGK